MSRLFNQRIINTKGFTLIELMIVLAVMALIATLTFPYLWNVIDSFNYKSDVITAEATAKLIQSNILVGNINSVSDDDITSAELGEPYPDSKLDDGFWKLSHDGSIIRVLYDRDNDDIKDDQEPYAELNVIQPQ